MESQSRRNDHPSQAMAVDLADRHFNPSNFCKAWLACSWSLFSRDHSSTRAHSSRAFSYTS